MEYANVIVDISHEKLDRVFQYRIPEHLKEHLKTGMQVQFPFGNGNRPMKGYVVGFTDTPDYPPEKIKELDKIMEGGVRAESQLIAMAAWMLSLIHISSGFGAETIRLYPPSTFVT